MLDAGGPSCYSRRMATKENNLKLSKARSTNKTMPGTCAEPMTRTKNGPWKKHPAPGRAR
jgi:hypothetical protein